MLETGIGAHRATAIDTGCSGSEVSILYHQNWEPVDSHPDHD